MAKKNILDKLFSWIDKKTKRKDGKQDYCSVSKDVWFGVDISSACEVHDNHYIKKDVPKLDADRKLYRDIVKLGKGKFRFKIVGFLYFVAVRTGGSIYSW